MGTNRLFDFKNNISANDALKIQGTYTRLTAPLIKTLFAEFCEYERFMGRNLAVILETYTKIILSNTMLQKPPKLPEEEGLFGPSSLDIPQDDPIDDALDVAHVYEQVSAILKNMFLMGVHTGRTQINGEFKETFDIENVAVESLVQEENTAPSVKIEVTEEEPEQEKPPVDPHTKKFVEFLEGMYVMLDDLGNEIRSKEASKEEPPQLPEPTNDEIEVTEFKNISEMMKFLREMGFDELPGDDPGDKG